MAGEWLLDKIKERGGSANEYADLQFGTVVSAKPLKVQLSEKITLDAPFLIVGTNVTNHQITMNIDGSDKKVMIKNELKQDDKVAMFRLDGGQQFYIFEKLSDQAKSDDG
ncbi:MAG: hypothetical protein [Bacteriophage sp.]|nr:MAG: hypothetical protein [Bacteriophage sp.]